MKIAYFTDTYLPKIDGVATSVDSFARELTRQGHEVMVFCPKQERVVPIAAAPSYGAKQVRVVHFNSFSYYFQPEVKLSVPTPLTSLREALQSFDIIHSHSPGPLGILAEEIALLRGIPHIHTFHTLLSEYNHYLFQGRLLTPSAIKKLSAFWCNRVDFIVAPSVRVKSELLKDGVARPIEVIPTGIDLARFSVGPGGFLVKNGLIKPSEFVFLTAGRLGREKSVDVIVRAFADLIGKIVSTRRQRLRLLIVGDGPERESLMRLVHNLDILAYVTFAGYINHENMPQVYGESDVFVFASCTETQGLVVLEAAAAGLPVVAIEDLAVGEVVKDQRNGFMVKNEQEMAEKMLELLENSKLRQSMLQLSGRIIQDFSIEITTKRMLEYYERSQSEYSARSRRQQLRNQYEALKAKFRQLTNL